MPSPASPPSNTEPPRVDPAVAQAATVPAQATRSKSAAPAPAPVGPERHGYSILVASFENRERAERLVEELTNAGFAAKAVGGVANGRFTLVRVVGYTAASNVQRDLQRIRALPGGYGDARIVEQ